MRFLKVKDNGGKKHIVVFNLIDNAERSSKMLPPDVTHPPIRYRKDAERYRILYPKATTWEVCPECESEVVIPAYRASRCPECGRRIIPCSMCDMEFMDCSRCMYGGNQDE